MICTQCGANHWEDLEVSTVFPDEIQQEFQCLNCGNVFMFRFVPVSIALVDTDDDVRAAVHGRQN